MNPANFCGQEDTIVDSKHVIIFAQCIDNAARVFLGSEA